MSELERDIRRWVESVDRPVPVHVAIEGAAPAPRWAAWPSWLPVPVAVGAVAVVFLLSVAVAIAGGGDDDGDVVIADDAATTTTTTTTSVPTTTTTSTPATTSSTASPSTTAAPTSSTSVPPSTTPPAPPPTVPPPEPWSDAEGCAPEDLRVEVHWESSGDRSEIVAAAGLSASYIRARTNTSDAPCTVSVSNCGSGETVRRSDGTMMASPIARSCPAMGHPPLELAPGETTRSTLRVGLTFPPGTYVVEVPMSDDPLPVRLTAQHAACPSDALSYEMMGTSAIREDGRVYSTVASDEDGCSIRATDVTVVVDPGGAAAAYSDPDDFWVIVEDGFVALYQEVGTIAGAPGSYPAEVSLGLEGGARLTVDAEVYLS